MLGLRPNFRALVEWLGVALINAAIWSVVVIAGYRLATWLLCWR